MRLMISIPWSGSILSTHVPKTFRTMTSHTSLTKFPPVNTEYESGRKFLIVTMLSYHYFLQGTLTEGEG
jgi:hypothetical protein